VGHYPDVGEGVDDEETPAGLVGSGRELEESVTACVGHLDAEGVSDDVERESEVPAGDTAVVTALAASSAAMCSAGAGGSSQVRSCSLARRRARRAPRGVGDRDTLKLRMGLSSWASGRTVSWFTSLSVAGCAYREEGVRRCGASLNICWRQRSCGALSFR
jgi:hypothetical protein